MRFWGSMGCMLLLGALFGGAVAPSRAQTGTGEPGAGRGEQDRGATERVAADRGGEAERLDTVVIRADRSLEERFASPTPRITVGRADIEQMGADTIADVLQRLPGVQVTGDGRGTPEIRMRGMDRGATQILVDGQRVGGGRASAQLPFDQIPADMIERIEVMRTPSAEYGGATAGTINIVMRQPGGQPQTQVRLSAQYAFDSLAPRLFASRTAPIDGTGGRWSGFVSLAASERLWGSDLQRRVDVADGSARADLDLLRGRTRELTVMPRLDGRLSARDTVILRGTLLAMATDARIDGAGTVMPAAGAPWSQSSLEIGETHRQMAQLRADWTRRLTGARLEARVSADRTGESIERQRLGVFADVEPPRQSQSGFDDRRVERSAQAALKLTGTGAGDAWTAGLEVESRRLSVDTALRADNAAPDERSLTSSYERRTLWGQNAWTLPGRASLAAGLRLEQLARAATDGGASRDEQHTQLQPTLHLRVPMADGWQLRGNLARTRRLPALTDTLDRVVPSWGGNSPTRPDSIGNPLLRPESTLSLDAGVERRLARGGQGGLNLFVRRIDDLIVRRVTEVGGRWQQRPENLGEALVWGLEADLRAPLAAVGAPGWNLSATASLLASRIDDGAGGSGRIPGQAHYLTNVSVSRPMPRGEGMFGGAALILRGAADLSADPAASGREHARASVEFHVGRVIRGLGFWRLDVHNIGNSRVRRERVDVDAAGASRAERSVEVYGTRAVFTVGTRW
jgi:outer membrane receptor for ferrienterochelin and colicins